MVYGKILPGVFQARPNRFIAHVEMGGRLEVCHVKNTGRCRELLVPGMKVWLEESANPARKTKYDLIAVEKARPEGPLLINMDSQAPNKVFGEWAVAGGLGFVPTLLRPETTYGNSRFDYYWEWSQEGEARRGFWEVKGVTLEEGGTARFPDAPTLRGVKHLEELVHPSGIGRRPPPGGAGGGRGAGTGVRSGAGAAGRGEGSACLSVGGKVLVRSGR